MKPAKKFLTCMNLAHYPHLFALRDAHVKLLKTHAHAKTLADEAISAASWAQIALFIQQARQTGRKLETLADRDAAQSLLNYWGNVFEQATGNEILLALEEFDRDGLISYAEAAWGQLSLDEQQIAAQILPQMARLVSTNNGNVVFHETVRRERVQHDVEALAEDTDRVLNRLVALGLIHITPHPNTSAEDQVQLANSALASQWARMNVWLERRRQTLRERLRLTSTAERWLRMGKFDEMLLKGNFLREAEAARDLSELETEFLQASRSTETLELRRQERWNGARRFFMLMLVAMGLLLGWDTYYQRQLANERQYAAQAMPLVERQVEQAFDYAARAYAAGSFGPAVDPVLNLFINAINPVKDSNHFQSRLALGAVNQRVSENLLHLARWRDSRIWAFAISPNGRWLATGDEDGKIIIADLSGLPQKSPRKLFELTEHDTTVFAAAFSPDSRVLATGGADGDIILWEMSENSSPTTLARIKAHNAPIFSIAFRPTDKPAYAAGSDTWLATGGQDGAVRLLKMDPDAQTQVVLREPTSSWVWRVIFSRDGKRLAATRQLETPEVWALDLQNPLNLVPSTLMSPISSTQVFIGSAFSPDGDWLATGDTANSLGFWKIDTGIRTFTETISNFFVWGVAWSDDGQTLALGSGNGRIQAFDVDYVPNKGPKKINNRRLLRGHADRDRNDAVFQLGFYPKDQNLLISGAWDGAVGIWDLLPQNMVTQHNRAVLALSYLANGQLISAGRDEIRQSDLPTTALQVSQPLSITPTPSRWPNPVVPALDVRMSADGRVIARLLNDGRVQVDTWDGVSSVFAIEGVTRGQEVTAFAISDDGAAVALGLIDGRAALKNIGRVASGAERPARIWPAANTRIDQIAIHPNGETVATANCLRINRSAGLNGNSRCQVASLALWRPNRADLAQQLVWSAINSPHHDSLTALRFNQDGSRLASGDRDGLILVWALTAGAMADGKQPTLTLARRENPITALVFSHNNDWLAASDNVNNGDGRVMLWDLAQAQLVGGGFIGHIGNITTLAFNADDRLLFSAGNDGRVFAWPSDPEAWLARACRFVVCE